VVDCGSASDEARAKWVERKTAQVMDEKRCNPLGTDTLLCEMIEAAGAPLFCAEGQGLTLVHFSAQLEPCLTNNNTLHTLNTP
jgi:hypothetical protein